MKEHISNIIGILAITAIFVLLFVFVMIPFLKTTIVPEVNVKLESWISSYLQKAMVGFAIAFLLVAFWYLWGAKLASFKNAASTKGRVVWFVLFVLLLALAMLLCFFIKAQEGIWSAWLGLVCMIPIYFFLTSLLFSPPIMKYVPPFSTAVRRW